VKDIKNMTNIELLKIPNIICKSITS